MKKETKELLKKVPGLRASVRFVKERVVDAKAISRFLAERKIKHTDDPIKVGFFCQYIPAWTKVEDLYRAMKDDPRFEPYLLCVPLGIKDNKLIDSVGTENDSYNYCLQKGYSEAVNTLIAPNTWMDLEELGLSYIFYPRPYNFHMPYAYTSKCVSKYCKICMIMYGIELSKETTDVALNRDFMSNVYFYFADFPSMEKANVKKNHIAHLLGLQKTLCTGYPMIEHLYRYEFLKSKSWEFSRNDFRVIWTPRWTTDPALGGTNFLKYYNEFLSFAQKHSSIDFLFRPHPLAFSHFLESGSMTEQELDGFIGQCRMLPNVNLDAEETYEATLWNSSVMVSDISSIMPEYFATAKPLIFCASNMGLDLAPHIRYMLEGCYIVNNADELFECILMLQSGEDHLLERRREISKELFGPCKNGVCAAILNHIISDSAT